MRTKSISPLVRCTYWLGRFVILRLLGLVYLVAFLTAAKQIVPLVRPMSIPAAYPWVFHLIWKLLNNDAKALSLFASNPFPNHPPRYIRAVLYRFSFAKPGNAQGEWWNRERLGLWLLPLSADEPRLAWLLRRASPADRNPSRPRTLGGSVSSSMNRISDSGMRR